MEVIQKEIFCKLASGKDNTGKPFTETGQPFIDALLDINLDEIAAKLVCERLGITAEELDHKTYDVKKEGVVSITGRDK